MTESNNMSLRRSLSHAELFTLANEAIKAQGAGEKLLELSMIDGFPNFNGRGDQEFYDADMHKKYFGIYDLDLATVPSDYRFEDGVENIRRGCARFFIECEPNGDLVGKFL